MKDIELVEMLDKINEVCRQYTGINQVEVYDGEGKILTGIDFKISHGYITLNFEKVEK